MNVPPTADLPTSVTHSSLSIYTRAKIDADKALRRSKLDYTIVRPGLLSDESGTGKVELAGAQFTVAAAVCPLLPRQETSVGAASRSHSCHEQTHLGAVRPLWPRCNSRVLRSTSRTTSAYVAQMPPCRLILGRRKLRGVVRDGQLGRPRRSLPSTCSVGRMNSFPRDPAG